MAVACDSDEDEKDAFPLQDAGQPVGGNIQAARCRALHAYTPQTEQHSVSGHTFPATSCGSVCCGHRCCGRENPETWTQPWGCGSKQLLPLGQAPGSSHPPASVHWNKVQPNAHKSSSFHTCSSAP